jgi:hypothetical protein
MPERRERAPRKEKDPLFRKQARVIYNDVRAHAVDLHGEVKRDSGPNKTLVLLDGTMDAIFLPNEHLKPEATH